MAFPTLVVKDGTGTNQTINTTPPAGQAASASSMPVVQASDDPLVLVSGTKTDVAAKGSGATLKALLDYIAGQGDSTLTNAPATVITGTLTSSGDIAGPLTVDGMNSITIEVIGTATGSAVVEVQPPGSTAWYGTAFEAFEGGPMLTNPVTGATSLFYKTAGGEAKIRVRATSAISSATTVNLSATNGLKRIGVRGSALNPVPTLPGASANTAGLTSARVVAAATTNAGSLKTAPGNIMNIDLFNVAAYDVFLKFFSKITPPTVGTDTPVWTIPIKAGTGYSRSFPQGKFFPVGIAYAITKLQADSDTTALAAGDVTGSVDFI